MLVNMMMLGLKLGPQIAAKTGIPAGLLFRRIWYSVWKSRVLGITEYRQGRPLEMCRKARLRWFGHMNRRDQEYVGRQTLEMVPPGRRRRGRPKQRWMYCVNRDMRAIGASADEDRTGWGRIVSPEATSQLSTRSGYKKKKNGLPCVC